MMRSTLLLGLGLLMCDWLSSAEAAEPIILEAISDFTIDEESPDKATAYIHKQKKALAINAAKYKDMYASASTEFQGPSGLYDVTVVALLETDGESSYKVSVAGHSLGHKKQNIPTEEDYIAYEHTFKNAQISQGDQLQVEFNTHTNKKIPEGDGTAYSRGRWVKLILTPVADPAAIETAAHFQEAGGLVVMEAESTLSDLGKWVPKTDVPNYQGEGHLEFTGNTHNGGPADSPLVYRFSIEKDGVYQLYIRCRKRLEGQPGDKCNDGYVRVVGDYDAVEGGAERKLLQSNTKLYGGDPDQWGWAKKLDAHKKYSPLYHFQAGKTYTLVLSGRSVRWNVDRLIFRHHDLDEAAVLGDKQLPESKRIETSK